MLTLSTGELPQKRIGCVFMELAVATEIGTVLWCAAVHDHSVGGFWRETRWCAIRNSQFAFRNWQLAIGNCWWCVFQSQFSLINVAIACRNNEGRLATYWPAMLAASPGHHLTPLLWLYPNLFHDFRMLDGGRFPPSQWSIGVDHFNNRIPYWHFCTLISILQTQANML